MKIPASLEEIHVSLVGLKITGAYKPPTSEFLCASIKDDKKTHYKVFFESSNTARRFKNTKKESVTLLEQLFTDDEGRELEKVYFITKKCAEAYVSNFISRATEEITRPDIHRPSFIDEEKEFEDDIYDEDMDELIEEFETDFTDKLTRAENRARNVLMSSAGYFMDIEDIENNKWLAEKIGMETRSLSLLLFQADVSELAIRKLMLAIYTNTASVKQFEALASLQKIVLDISKNQSLLVERMIKDFKEMKIRVKEISDKEISTGVEDNEMIEGVVLKGNNIGNILSVAGKLRDDAQKRIEDADFEEED